MDGMGRGVLSHCQFAGVAVVEPQRCQVLARPRRFLRGDAIPDMITDNLSALKGVLIFAAVGAVLVTVLGAVLAEVLGTGLGNSTWMQCWRTVLGCSAGV